jgi:RimJ/RimL family protein N-acetyltransferase
MGSAETPDANFLPLVEIPVDHDEHDIMLRRYDLIDPADKYKLLNDNRLFWGRALRWALTASERTVKLGHRWTEQQVAEGTQAPYGVEVDGQLAGAVILHSREEGTAEMGYQLGRKWLRQGITTRAARAVADFGLGDWGLDEIKLYIRPANKPSIATARKLGAQSLGKITRVDSRGWHQPYTAWRLAHDER